MPKEALGITTTIKKENNKAEYIGKKGVPNGFGTPFFLIAIQGKYSFA